MKKVHLEDGSKLARRSEVITRILERQNYETDPFLGDPMLVIPISDPKFDYSNASVMINALNENHAADLFHETKFKAAVLTDPVSYFSLLKSLEIEKLIILTSEDFVMQEVNDENSDALIGLGGRVALCAKQFMETRKGEETTKINITVQDEPPTYKKNYRINKYSKIRKIIELHSKKGLDFEIHQSRFLFDGCVLNESNRFVDYDMEDGDIIMVIKSQCGC